MKPDYQTAFAAICKQLAAFFEEMSALISRGDFEQAWPIWNDISKAAWRLSEIVKEIKARQAFRREAAASNTPASAIKDVPPKEDPCKPQ